VGGRGTLDWAVIGALLVNLRKNPFPQAIIAGRFGCSLWRDVFVLVTLYLPKGFNGFVWAVTSQTKNRYE